MADPRLSAGLASCDADAYGHQWRRLADDSRRRRAGGNRLGGLDLARLPAVAPMAGRRLTATRPRELAADRRTSGMRTSQPIRRVLSLPGGRPPRRWRPSISTCCCQHARAARSADPAAAERCTGTAAAAYPGARAGHPRTLPVWPCSGWGLPSHPRHRGCWWSLTPPFHPYRTLARPAVCFLWHCPAGHPGWALPTTLPCGARTFLGTGEPVTRPPG